MICDKKAGQYCRQAAKHEKYAKYRGCNKCCIDCIELCGNLCDKALEIKNKSIEGDNCVRDR